MLIIPASYSGNLLRYNGEYMGALFLDVLLCKKDGAILVLDKHPCLVIIKRTHNISRITRWYDAEGVFKVITVNKPPGRGQGRHLIIMVPCF